MSPLRLLAALLALSSPVFAQVLRVPSQHRTIAAALAAASSGTTILVAPGLYAERITWPATGGIRLIAEQGFARTTIDGQKKGTVIVFNGGQGRSTLLEGFTITGGFLSNSNGRNHGAGIHISRASPTILGNRITGNASDGPYWNYGGALYVGSSSNPRVEANRIESNELRNGAWNYGAGVYIARLARVELAGNVIRANRNHSPAPTTTNRGYGAGVYVDGAGTIASNLVAGNICSTNGWNLGGGIKVGVGTTSVNIVNNTFVANTCTGGIWNYGGGFHADASTRTTAAFTGNIVASNIARGGTFTGAGGLHRGLTGGKVTLDYNDVWNNTGGNYKGFTAGPNSISKDPGFAGPSDHHLTKLSPCVDAMPASFLPSQVAIDMDGGPRRIDGNLDGLRGNGARLDIGADEFSQALLTMIGTPRLGTTVTMTVGFTAPPAIFALLLDFKVGRFFVDPYGELLLSLGMITVAGGTTPGSYALLIPKDQRVAGVTVYQQALVLKLPPQGIGQLSNRSSFTIY